MSNEKRPYRLKQRAESQEQTRQRITEATAELHGTVGPAHTTISAVARRAGVQRATVYRHFADERALFAACSAHWNSQHVPPDPGPWAAIEDPEERLRIGLGALYGWYRDGEPMLHNLLRDEQAVAVLREELLPPFHGYLAAIADLLRAGRDGGDRTAAALGHAVSFGAWRDLKQRGLTDADIVALMAGLVAAG